MGVLLTDDAKIITRDKLNAQNEMRLLSVQLKMKKLILNTVRIRVHVCIHTYE